METFIIRIELNGFREYAVEAETEEEAENKYYDNLLDDDKVKLVKEGFEDSYSCISEIRREQDDFYGGEDCEF